MLRTALALPLLATAFGLLVAGCGGDTGDAPGKRTTRDRTTALASNGLIAFERDGRIFVVQPNGRRPTRLTAPKRTSVGPFFGQPAWSPDGKQLAFIRMTFPTHEYDDVVVADVRGTAITRLRAVASTGGAISGDPAWSPDGRDIVYGGTDYEYGGEVLVFAGTGRVPLPEYADVDEGTGEIMVADAAPTWSPDGRWICFARIEWTVSDRYDLYFAEPDGQPVKPLGVSGYAPDWSPDGREIVFVRGGDVYVVQADGSREMRLTETTEMEADPAWSPDGSRILFAREDRSGRRTRDGFWPTGVWMMAPDGGGVRRLIRAASHPDWQPVPGAP